MRIRTDIYPKAIRDAFATGFMFVTMPIVYYFELFIVSPRYNGVDSPAHYFHFICGTVIIFNIYANLVAIMMSKTSIKGLVLSIERRPDWRYCAVCETLAPPRSRHCNVCNVCILKRDHHCKFTSCCIGFENHRYYIVFLVYLLSGCLYASYYNLNFVADHIHFNWSWKSLIKLIFSFHTFFAIEWTEYHIYILVIIIVLLATLFTGALLIFHVNLMLRSVVTNERNITKYNRGKLENIKLTLGERWYLVWLSPWIESKLPCDGINWEKMSVKEQ
ncbi:unnamed protein product [Psylliodes chrysocephalus]|uniref:Palmitoyltransferase n=1 Tax=Psylliodes chrysocephalus TaxID=3402493 RepID=A0A9P0G5R7_9CUCU|nr:unnamed protein product [Psylliodes chrysocephala]